MAQRAKGELYYNRMVDYLKDHFTEIRDKYDSLDDFLEDNEFTEPDEATVELPKTLIAGRADANKQTCYQNNLFWKMDGELAGVTNKYQYGRMIINVPVFIEEELGGWPDTESAPHKNNSSSAHAREDTETSDNNTPPNPPEDHPLKPENEEETGGRARGD